jgi:hypothetical protein
MLLKIGVAMVEVMRWGLVGRDDMTTNIDDTNVGMIQVLCKPLGGYEQAVCHAVYSPDGAHFRLLIIEENPCEFHCFCYSR